MTHPFTLDTAKTLLTAIRKYPPQFDAMANTVINEWWGRRERTANQPLTHYRDWLRLADQSHDPTPHITHPIALYGDQGAYHPDYTEEVTGVLDLTIENSPFQAATTDQILLDPLNHGMAQAFFAAGDASRHQPDRITTIGQHLISLAIPEYVWHEHIRTPRIACYNRHPDTRILLPYTTEHGQGTTRNAHRITDEGLPVSQEEMLAMMQLYTHFFTDVTHVQRPTPNNEDRQHESMPLLPFQLVPTATTLEEWLINPRINYTFEECHDCDRPAILCWVSYIWRLQRQQHEPHRQREYIETEHNCHWQQHLQETLDDEFEEWYCSCQHNEDSELEERLEEEEEDDDYNEDDRRPVYIHSYSYNVLRDCQPVLNPDDPIRNTSQHNFKDRERYYKKRDMHPLHRLVGVEEEWFATRSLADVCVTFHDQAADWAIMKEDGSLDGQRGFEFVTAPMHYKAHEARWMDLQTVMRANASGWTRRGYGMHIHAERSGLTISHVGMLDVFVNADGNKHFMNYIAGREAGIYCHRVTKTIKAGLDMAKKGVGDKYWTLNTVPRGSKTLEFRMFQSTTKAERVLQNIQFVLSLIAYVQTMKRPKKLIYTPRDYCEYVTGPQTTSLFPLISEYVSKYQPFTTTN